MKNLGLFVTFYMNLHTRIRSQAQKLGLRLRLHQKVAAPQAPAPAPQHCLHEANTRFALIHACWCSVRVLYYCYYYYNNIGSELYIYRAEYIVMALNSCALNHCQLKRSVEIREAEL
jgi:hypothetical protein